MSNHMLPCRCTVMRRVASVSNTFKSIIWVYNLPSTVLPSSVGCSRDTSEVWLVTIAASIGNWTISLRSQPSALKIRRETPKRERERNKARGNRSNPIYTEGTEDERTDQEANDALNLNGKQ